MSSRLIPLKIPAGDLALEGAAHPPASVPKAVAAVAHPHPAYGGSMDNNVVQAICEALVGEGIHAVRFNFRGVGHSQGVSEGGLAEAQDVHHVAQFLTGEPALRDLPLFLAGYSFGAWAALQAARQLEHLAAFIAVSPPLALFPLDFLAEIEAPILFIVGDRDSFCDLSHLSQAIDSARRVEKPHVVPGADHFWWGYEDRLAALVGQFCRERLNA